MNNPERLLLLNLERHVSGRRIATMTWGAMRMDDCFDVGTESRWLNLEIVFNILGNVELRIIAAVDHETARFLRIFPHSMRLRGRFDLLAEHQSRATPGKPPKGSGAPGNRFKQQLSTVLAATSFVGSPVETP